MGSRGRRETGDVEMWRCGDVECGDVEMERRGGDGTCSYGSADPLAESQLHSAMEVAEPQPRSLKVNCLQSSESYPGSGFVRRKYADACGRKIK